MVEIHNRLLQLVMGRMGLTPATWMTGLGKVVRELNGRTMSVGYSPGSLPRQRTTPPSCHSVAPHDPSSHVRVFCAIASLFQGKFQQNFTVLQDPPSRWTLQPSSGHQHAEQSTLCQLSSLQAYLAIHIDILVIKTLAIKTPA